MLRQRFPYEFRTIEEYGPGKKTVGGIESHLKRLVQIDGHLRQLYFYPHRNKDGLVYREEQIEKKHIERYKSRADRLVYRSFTFSLDKTGDPKAISIKALHCKGDVVVKKMTQKYELDVSRPPEGQLRKIVINYDKRMIYEYYHYTKNNVKEVCTEHSLEHLRATEANDKVVDTKGTEEKKKALNLIMKNCMSEILAQEAAAEKELTETPPAELFEKTIFDKARERVSRLI